MAGIHGLKHVESLYAANLTHKDSIRTHTQRILQNLKVVQNRHDTQVKMTF